MAGRSKSIQGYWGNTVNVKGNAPAASILFRSWDDGSSYSGDFEIFRNNAVQISNHSYGYASYDYNSDTANYDAYCDNDDMVLVMAAGNDWYERKVKNPATGKNVLTVGAISFVTDSASSETIGARAAYSSQGPTADDSRLKPDLVAPGGSPCDTTSHKYGVVSTVSEPWSHDCTGNSGNLNGNYQFPEWESDDGYLRMSGTSMAAPHVAGLLGLMKQWKPDFHSGPSSTA